jgi:hypothetical protein
VVRRVSDSACPVVEVVVVRLVQHVCVCTCRLQPPQTLASQHINSACAIKFVEECIAAVIVIMINVDLLAGLFSELLLGGWGGGI